MKFIEAVVTKKSYDRGLKVLYGIEDYKKKIDSYIEIPTVEDFLKDMNSILNSHYDETKFKVLHSEIVNIRAMLRDYNPDVESWKTLGFPEFEGNKYKEKMGRIENIKANSSKLDCLYRQLGLTKSTKFDIIKNAIVKDDELSQKLIDAIESSESKAIDNKAFYDICESVIVGRFKSLIDGTAEYPRYNMYCWFRTMNIASVKLYNNKSKWIEMNELDETKLKSIIFPRTMEKAAKDPAE